MLTLVGIAIGTVAVGAWLVAVYSAFSAIALVPGGKRLSAWFTLGWWQFDKLRALAGPAIEPHLKRYVQAFLAFFVAVLLAAGLGVLLGMEEQNGNRGAEQAAEPARITDPRIIAVHIADIGLSISHVTTDTQANHRALEAAA
jgi:hypothetical protein